ncbi:MAG TPA: Gfo/Idh/MocA family oxidoreductase [Opitutaceae bacterium]|nr:Gfo/Idh/MocA family oxidoreductase [Opitutaceae bacterium]
MKKLGLGVLGLGEGRSIISAGLHSELWDVVALCDLNASLGRERCAEFALPAEKFTTSLDALLANPAVDVVGIYTPDHLHADHVIRALRAGKHVVCTKPFLDSLARAAEVLAAVKASGRRVMVGQSSRFFAPFARQREHFESGVFGELNSVEAYYNADHRWFLAKGWAKTDAFKWLYGGLSHPVDFIRWYLPDVEEVMGYARLSENGRKLGLVHDDTFHFVYRARSGRIARVSGTYTAPVTPNSRDSNMSCVLRGSLGAGQADYYELRYAWKTDLQSVVETFEDRDDYFFRFGGHSHHAGEYQGYIEYFARCLARGEAPKPDVGEGIVTVALMQAMEEAARKGGPVKVRDVLARHGLEELAP